jgi:hypothetical protein
MVRLKACLAGGGCKGGLSGWWVKAFFGSHNNNRTLRLLLVLSYNTAGGSCKGRLPG